MSTRKCVEFESALDAAVECRRNLSAPIAGYESHLAECVDCQSRWQSARFLDETLAVWATAIPPIDLVASVLRFTAEPGQIVSGQGHAFSVADFPPDHSAVKSHAVHAAKSSDLADRSAESDVPLAAAVRPNPIAAFVVLAIVASVVLATGWLAIPHHSSELSDGVIARTGDHRPVSEAGVQRSNNQDSKQSATPKPINPEVEISGLFRDAGTAYLSLAEEAADRVRDVATLVAQSRNNANPQSGILRSDSPQESQVIDKSSTPWEKRLDRAFEFLMEAIPETESPPS